MVSNGFCVSFSTLLVICSVFQAVTPHPKHKRSVGKAAEHAHCHFPECEAKHEGAACRLDNDHDDCRAEGICICYMYQLFCKCGNFRNRYASSEEVRHSSRHGGSNHEGP